MQVLSTVTAPDIFAFKDILLFRKWCGDLSDQHLYAERIFRYALVNQKKGMIQSALTYYCVECLTIGDARKGLIAVLQAAACEDVGEL